MTGRFFSGAIFGVVRFKNKQSSLMAGGVLLASEPIIACASVSGMPCPRIRETVNNERDELCMHCAPNSVASFSSTQGNGSTGAAHRKRPRGGAANGTPRNTASRSSSVFCQSPDNRPCSTSALGGSSIVVASVDRVALICCPMGIQDN